MTDDVAAFYDTLAADYHLIFADWRASIERQGAVLDGIIAAAIGPGPRRILDCACGIGTQAIGLALRGHRVHGTDISPSSVARARDEAAALGVELTFAVADIRSLDPLTIGRFEVVVACDNALPHLLTEADLAAATAGMAAVLEPGGLLVATIRDYDALLGERPRLDPPRLFEDAAGRRLTFQLWDWAPDGRTYLLHHFILTEEANAWRTHHARTRYRALRQADLAAALAAAGLTGIAWHTPPASGFYQPLVTARKPQT